PSICPYDARVLGSRVGLRGTAGRGNGVVAVSPRPANATPAPSRVFSAGLLPRVSFGFGITCSRCAARPDEDSTVVWRFRELPEIYSVESQSQAFRAGIRRGDLITHIDNVDITSEEGGRRFGRVQPGQNVRFTFQRGSATTTRELRAESRRGVFSGPVAAARVATENSLLAARQLVERIRVQELQTRDQIEQLRAHEDSKLQELAQRLISQQGEQRRRLEQLYSELAQLDRTPSPKLLPTPGSAKSAEPKPAPVPPRADRNTSRYSGRLGETDIEVRGPVGVYVERTDDEIIIYVGDSTIRLKRSDRR
ncbi:MAG: PDZ domain-containing protein, partial [Longimicrobiales bacterium]